MNSKIVLIILSILSVSIMPSGHSAAETDSSESDRDTLNVIAKQTDLKYLGFYKGPIDGLTSKQLESSIKDFQRIKKLEITGVVDDNTNAALIVERKAQLQKCYDECVLYSNTCDLNDITNAYRELFESELNIGALKITVAQDQKITDGDREDTTSSVQGIHKLLIDAQYNMLSEFCPKKFPRR